MAKTRPSASNFFDSGYVMIADELRQLAMSKTLRKVNLHS
jgi:hypothetical protein